MKNPVYPVCRDTQLPHSSIRFLRFILPASEFYHFTNPTLRQNLNFVKHDRIRPLKNNCSQQRRYSSLPSVAGQIRNA